MLLPSLKVNGRDISSQYFINLLIRIHECVIELFVYSTQAGIGIALFRILTVQYNLIAQLTKCYKRINRR